MLLELSVRNLLIVDAVCIEPGEGLTVITGETGAGKSLLLDAIDLLLGGRASAELVGPNGDDAQVSAAVLPTQDAGRLVQEVLGEQPSLDEPLLLRRRVTRQGRSQAWINDIPVSVRSLAAIARSVLELRSQNEQLRLAEPQYQQQALDSFAGNEALAASYAQAHRQLLAARQELQELQEGSHDSVRELEFVRYQLAEFASVQPVAGEEEALEQRQAMLAGAVEWRQLCEEVVDCLAEGESAVLPMLGTLAGRLQQAPDASLLSAGEACMQAKDMLADAVRSCASAADSISPDPQALAEVDDRLQTLVDLMRKHGGSESAMLERWQALQDQEVALQGLEQRCHDLARDCERLAQEREELGQRLAAARSKASGPFARKVCAELKSLGMPKVVLQWEGVSAQQPSASAFVAQRWSVQTNPGMPPGPLSKVPSGGEMSRLSLAMAVVQAAAGRASSDGAAPTLIFDEIDSGVGGRLGTIMAQKLKDLARGCSVLAVSHTPQMAAVADRQYRVSKTQGDDRTAVQVEDMSGENRIAEIAEMLGGGEAALNQARVLLGDIPS